MLRNGQWYSYDTENQWLSFDALKVVHKVTPVTKGERYSITLFTPGKLGRLTAQDRDHLAKAGFPIYLYEPLPAKMRRLTTPSHVMSLTPESERVQETLAKWQSRPISVSSSLVWCIDQSSFVADPNDANLLRPKTLLDCCQCAQDFLDEYDLNDGYDKGTLYLMRVYGHRTRMLIQFQYLQAAAERN